MGRRDVPRAEARCCTTAGSSTGVGDEGGFAPDLPSNEEALQDARRRRSRRPVTSPARMWRSRSTPAATELYGDGAYVLARTRGARSTPARSSTTAPTWSTATRSCRSRTAWPRTTGTAGRALTERARRAACSSSATTCSSPTTERLDAGHRRRRRQLDPDQGQPDRHAHRDARHGDRVAARAATRR